MMRVSWFVGHDPHIFSTDTITTIVFGKYDLFLQQHNQLAGFTVLMKKFFRIVEFIDMFPSATGEWFHVRRETDVIKYMIPVERINKVTERIIRSVVRKFA